MGEKDKIEDGPHAGQTHYYEIMLRVRVYVCLLSVSICSKYVCRYAA